MSTQKRKRKKFVILSGVMKNLNKPQETIDPNILFHYDYFESPMLNHSNKIGLN